MAWLTRTLGVVLIAIAMVDIFMTVLYPRTGNSLLSMPISKGTWNIFRQIARWSKSTTRSDAEGSRLLSYCGSVILVIVAIVWIALFISVLPYLFGRHWEMKLSPVRGKLLLTSALLFTTVDLTLLLWESEI